MRRMGAAAVVAALALVAAGCGGSSDSGVGRHDGELDRCLRGGQRVCRHGEGRCEVQRGAGEGHERQERRVAAASQAFADMADEVPAELSDDFQALADAFAGYADALKGITIKAGTAPTAAQIKQLAAAAKSLDQKAVEQASKNIDAWIQANCR